MACVQDESKSPGRKTETEAPRAAVVPCGPWATSSIRITWELAKCTFPGPAPNLLTVKPSPYFQSPSGDSGAGSSLGPGGLKHAQCCWSSLFPPCSAELHLVPASKPSLLPSATGSPVPSQRNYSFCSLPPPHCLFHSLAFPLFFINQRSEENVKPFEIPDFLGKPAAF